MDRTGTRRVTIPWLSLGLLAVLLIGSPAARGEAGGRVECWDIFELSLDGPSSGNPFVDVRLGARFTQGDAVFTSEGFYDGDGTWRVRFMPDELGTWRYEMELGDGAAASGGTFECVASTIPGMLDVDAANPMWFGLRGGRHRILRSLHVGDRFFASNWPDEKRTAFLDWADAQGYNMLSIASHYLNRESEGRGLGWDTPDLWNDERRLPRPEEYAKTEAILDRLAERGIAVFPFAGFIGKASDFPRDQNDQQLYIRYTLARIGAYWNILFNVAGPEPNLPSSVYLESDDVERLGRAIRKADPYGHPLSVHNRTGDDPYRDSDWSTYGVLQGPKTTNRGRLSRGLLESHHPEKPLYAQETLWAGNRYHKEPYTVVDLRKNAYVIGMSAGALNFGDMDGNSSSGFSGTLELDARVQQRHDIVHRVWDFFETVPYYRMQPAQDFVSRGYCLADPGREYLVYLEDGGTVDVRIDGGSYLIQWIDAQNTFDRRYGGSTDDGQDLAAPADGDDWLLRLRKPTERFSVKEDNTGTTLGGRPMLVAGLRLSNALISDEKTQELIDHLDEFAGYGVNTFSVFFQGSRFGDIRGYRRDGSLDPKYAVRMGRLIEAAAERDMVVLVGVLYYGDSKAKWDQWEQADAERAVANTVRWLQQNGYRNVMVDVNNEHMAQFDDFALIAAGKRVDPDCVIATSGKDTPKNADLSLHHGSPDLPDKYYIESEGTCSGYWGSYSKDPAVYNYIRIGEYTPEMKAEMLARTDRYLDRGQGYMFASTWLQCVPPEGPNHRPGGDGTPEDPGVRWWLEHLREKVGEHTHSKK